MPLVCELADAEKIGDRPVFVAQERKWGAEPMFEGLENPGRVNRNCSNTLVCDLGGVGELHELSQLKLSLGSPRASKECDE